MNFKKLFLDSLDHIKKIRKFVWIIVLFFILFAFIGFSFPVPDVISQRVSEFVQQLLSQTKGLDFFGLFNFIFWNNLKVSFFGMILGIFFGVFPIITIIANGYLLGIVSSAVVKQESFFVLWRLLPHGIFELPAIFISLAFGLEIGMFVFEKNKLAFLKRSLRESLSSFLVIIIPLLIIAALIETLFIFLGN